MMSSRAGIGVGIVLLVSMVGGAGAAWYFIKQQLAPLVQKNLTQTLNRPVQLGNVESFSLFGEMRFGHSAVPATPTDPETVQIQEVDVRFNPLQLLFSRTLILDATLLQPDIYLQQDTKGRWINTTIKQGDSTGLLKTELKFIRVRQGHLLLLPYSKTVNSKQPIAISQLNVDAQFVDNNQRVSFNVTGTPVDGGSLKINGNYLIPTQQIAAAASGQNIPLANLSRLINLPGVNLLAGSADGSVDLRFTLGKTPLVSGNAQMKQATVQISQLPKLLTNTTGDLALKDNTIELQNVSSVYGQIPAQATGIITPQSLDVQAKTVAVPLSNILNTLDLKLPVAASGVAAANLKITGPLNNPVVSGSAATTAPALVDKLKIQTAQANFTLVGKKVSITDVQAIPEVGGEINATGTVNLGAKGGVVFDFQGSNLPGNALALIYGVTVTPHITIGNLNLKGQILGPTGTLETVAQFSAPNATYPGSGEIDISPGGNVSLRNASFQVAGGTVSPSGKIVDKHWQASIQATNIHGNQLTPLIGRPLPPPLQGILSGSFQLSGNNLAFKPEKIAASGSGELHLAEGTIAAKNVQLNNGRWQGIFYGSDLEVGSLSAQVPPSLKAGRLYGNFNLSGSLTAFNPETITGTGSGYLNLPGGKINADSIQLQNATWQGNFLVNNVQLASLSPQLPRQFQGNLNGNFNLSGSLTAFNPETITGKGSGSLNLPGGKINAALQLRGGRWQGNFSANDVRLANLSPQLPSQFQGILTGNFNLSGSLTAFKPETITGTGSGSLNLPGGKIIADSLRLGDGRWQGNFTANDVQLASLSPQLPEQFQGILTGNFNLSGSLTAFKPATITGSGSAQLNLPQGNITASSLQLSEGRWQGAFVFNNLDLSRLAQLAKNIPSLDSRVAAPPVQGLLSGSVNAFGSLTALDPKAIKVSGDLGIKNLAVDGLKFEPLLAGSVTVAPGQGVNLDLAGNQDRIKLALSPSYQPVSFFIQSGATIASGEKSGDRLVADLQKLPIGIIKELAPLPSNIANQKISGDLSGHFDINLATKSIIANNVEIDKPTFGTISGDRFTGNVTYNQGIATLNNGELQLGNNLYAVNAKVTQTANGPQFQARLNIPKGQIQEIFTAFQIFDLQDLTSGLKKRTYGSAADIPVAAAGLPNATLLNQVRRLSEIQALLSRQQAQREAAIIPELSELSGAIGGDISVSGSLKQGITANFDLQGSDWKWGRYRAGQVVVKGNFNNGVLTLLPLRITTDQTVVSYSGTLGGDQQSGQLQVQNLPIDQLQDFVNLPVHIGGDLNINATISGSIQNPASRGAIGLVKGTLNNREIKHANISFNYEDTRLYFSSTAQVAGTDSTQSNQVSFSGNVPYKLPFATVLPTSNNFSLAMNVNDEGLASIDLLTNGQVSWIGGKGQVNLKITGNLSPDNRPENAIAKGNAQFTNGILQAQALPEPLTDVNGNVSFDLNHITVENLQGKFNKGKVEATGVIPISDRSRPGKIDNPLTVVLSQIALNIKGRYSGGVDGNVVIQGTALNPRIGGKVNLVNGQVLLPSTKTSIATSAASQQDNTANRNPIELNNLEINLGKGVQITSPPILNFLATGSLLLNGSLDDIRPAGVVDLKRGQVNLFTTQFRLTRGDPQTAVFLPDLGLIPNLDVRLLAIIPEAIGNRRIPTQPLSGEISDMPNFDQGTVQTVRIIATVRGPADKIQQYLTLSSSPQRSDAEIVALLGGSFVDTLGRGDTTLGLADLAGSALLGNFQNAITNTLGVSDFRIFPTTIISKKTTTPSILGLNAEIGIDITSKISLSASKILNASDPAQFGALYRVNGQLLLRGSTNFSDDNRASLQFERRF